MVHLLKKSQLRAPHPRAPGSWTAGSWMAAVDAPAHRRPRPRPKRPPPDLSCPGPSAADPPAASAPPSRFPARLPARFPASARCGRAAAVPAAGRQARRRRQSHCEGRSLEGHSLSARPRNATPRAVSAFSVPSFGATPPIRAPDRPRSVGRPRIDLKMQYIRIRSSRECAHVAAAPLLPRPVTSPRVRDPHAPGGTRAPPEGLARPRRDSHALPLGPTGTAGVVPPRLAASPPAVRNRRGGVRPCRVRVRTTRPCPPCPSSRRHPRAACPCG